MRLNIRIDPKSVINWDVARKVKSIRAKPLSSVLIDINVISKFLFNTLEGEEPLSKESVVCLGEAGDIWQQSPKKLLKTYSVTDIDSEGWLVCTPNPNNAVDVVQISCPEGMKEFSIIGLYGKTVGDETNVQFGVDGDFLCKSKTDPKDVWIVKKQLFENTYQIIEK